MGIEFFHNIPGRSKLSNTDILRASIMAELDAINLYEGFADVVENDAIRNILLDIAEEEKIHVGEFQHLLVRVDEDYRNAMDIGRVEVDKKVSK